MSPRNRTRARAPGRIRGPRLRARTPRALDAPSGARYLSPDAFSPSAFLSPATHPLPRIPGIPQKRVQDYGCFVDFGAKSDGLVHISELTNGFVDVSNVVSENQEVTVWIKSIDTEKGRISLTMKPHGGGARGHQGQGG